MSRSTEADEHAAQAVVNHHRQLAVALTRHVSDLVDAAEIGGLRQVWHHRDALLGWLHTELLPHAYAEEAAMYPAAAEQPAGRLLIDGMMDEHRTIAALVAELEETSAPVAAAAAARALQAVFSTHLAKENELVVPLLVAAPEVSLAELLDGMHDLIGGEKDAGCGGHCGDDAGAAPVVALDPIGGEKDAGCGGHCGCGGDDAAGVAPVASLDPIGGEKDAGCGGHCGCGGDDAAGVAPVSMLSIDPRLDVRDLPHGERHARVIAALDALPADGALVLVAPHAPLPLLAEIDDRYSGQMTADWLQDGPDVWQIRLHRVTVGV
ncbi:DUF2249 domain-containing protein [Actinoplanes sp. NPDC049802]|uniref:DUF2249 domain-containing protein n=1 Tax=Actinoplanes sp. NPDC049802 TaxID=3154742 RepID=UPI003408AA24